MQGRGLEREQRLLLGGLWHAIIPAPCPPNLTDTATENQDGSQELDPGFGVQWDCNDHSQWHEPRM